MFENLIKTLEILEGGSTYTMDIECDKDGYIDKECPNQDCMSKFKVLAEDWKGKISEEHVCCPFCGHVAPANSWWTTEQIEQAKEQAVRSIGAMINDSIEKDVKQFNRHSPKKGFIRVSMKFSGSTYAPNLPAEALEEMEQKITCEKCGTHYAVIGSAFYCPCCGHNSARQTFFNSIEKVKSKINNLEVVRNAIADVNGKDEAARTCESLVETSTSDLVVAFQRLCECAYPQMPNSGKIKKNEFQRLSDGSALWKNLVGRGYEDWLEPGEFIKLKKCFQQRHLLQHKDGIVDRDYIDRSFDKTCSVGQRITIKATDILEYAAIVEKLGGIILGLLNSSQK